MSHGILIVMKVFLVGYSHDVALIRVELHLPFEGPLVEPIEVFLEMLRVIDVGDRSIYQAIICK